MDEYKVWDQDKALRTIATRIQKKLTYKTLSIRDEYTTQNMLQQNGQSGNEAYYALCKLWAAVKILNISDEMSTELY